MIHCDGEPSAVFHALVLPFRVSTADELRYVRDSVPCALTISATANATTAAASATAAITRRARASSSASSARTMTTAVRTIDAAAPASSKAAHNVRVSPRR